MINTVRIKNFQGHKESFLSLSEGVNVIIGNSNEGKTAILRALEWVRSNKPSGVNYFRNGLKKGIVEVALTFTENKIKLERTKGFRLSKAQKKIAIPEQDIIKINDIELKSFGRSIPKEVNDILLLDDINISHQHDAEFLISSSNGEISRVFNSLMNFDKIQLWVKSINAQTNSKQKEIELNTLERKQAQEKLAKLKNLQPIENKGKDLNTTQESIQTIQTQIATIEKIIEKINLLPDLDIDLNLIKCKINDLESIEKDISNIIRFKNKAIALIALKVPEMPLKLTGNIKSLTDISKNISQTNKLKTSLKQIIEKLVSNTAKIYTNMNYKQSIISKLKVAIKKNNICNLCGNKMELSNFIKE